MKLILYLTRTYVTHLDNRIWFLVLFSLAVGLLDSLGLTLIIPLLEGVNKNSKSENDGVIIDLFNLFGVEKSVCGVLLFIFLLFLIKGITKFSMAYYQANLHKKLTVKLRVDMYNSIVEVDYNYFSKYNIGHFMTILNHHLMMLIASFTNFISLFSGLIIASTYIFIAISISWEIGFLSLLIGSLAMLLFVRVVKYVKLLSREISTLEKINTQIAIQALYAYKYVVSTYSYKIIKRIYSESISNITEKWFKTQIANAFTKSLQELLGITILLIIIAVEVLLWNKSISSVLIVAMLLYRTIGQLSSVQLNFQHLSSNIGKVESANSEIVNLRKNKSHNGLITLERSINDSSIQFNNVFFDYGDEQPVLQNLSLTIDKNETVAFVGSSGAGKSTTVDLIIGLIKPTKGSITCNGVEIVDLDHRFWRSKIGYVNQDIMLFDTTIRNNITMFDDNAEENRIIDALKFANIWDFVENSEKGLETIIGDKGMKLSGGQKQRLTIAREIFKKPELLILDEATSALDAESESIIQEAIRLLKGKITLIIIAHRLSTIKNCDNIFVFDKGKIVEQGTFKELVGINKRFNHMVKMQFQDE